MADDELVRLDYEQTTQLVRALTEVRFKLLAFVPTLAGAAVAFLSEPGQSARLVAVGLLGLVATVGIFTYELTNSRLYDAAVRRAEMLEQRLRIEGPEGDARAGGLFSEGPGRTARLLGLLPVSQERGLGLVYAAALAGWAYLVGWGALALVDVPGARVAGALVGVVVGALVVYEAGRLDAKRG